MIELDAKLVAAMQEAADGVGTFVAQAKKGIVNEDLANVLRQALEAERALHKAVGDVMADIQRQVAELQRQLYDARMQLIQTKADDGSVANPGDATPT